MPSLETWVIDIIEERRFSIVAKPFLYLISCLFYLGVKIKNTLYNSGLKKSKKTKAPVISIGNIVAGGTGKTAFIQFFAKELSKSHELAILSRGYRSEYEHGSHLISNQCGPNRCGDEPYLIKKNVPNVHMIVGKNRLRGAQLSVKRGAQLILLDDGMQHRKMYRNQDIVMLNCNDLFGKGYYLPRGYLRDDPKRLKSADLIILHHIKDESHFDQVKKELISLTTAPMIGSKMRVIGVRDRGGSLNPDVKKAGLFCGLGHPKSFQDTAIEMGIEIVEKLILPDHIAPTEEELKSLLYKTQAKGAEILLCTEKDWVKLPERVKYVFSINYVDVTFQIISGMAHYNAFKSDVLELINNSKA